MKNVPRKPKEDIGNINDVVDSLAEAQKYASEHIVDLSKELILFEDGAERGPLMGNLEHKLQKICHGVNVLQLSRSIIVQRCLELVAEEAIQ